jgi:His/Glu/Gln/Arg/opine family amino acid ABC transporter permease subunit
MDYSVITNNFSFFLKGFVVTLQLTALTLIGGLIVGTPLALGRSAQAKLPRYISIAVIEVVRGTPILMLIFWIYFLLPQVIGTAVNAYVAGLIALITFNAAYSAEIIRAGIQSVDRGNIEAGRSSGLTWLQISRHIVLPQAFSNMKPALMSQAVMVYKTTSLIFVIGVVDFFRAATIINNREFKSFEIFAFVALVYFIPCTIISRWSRSMEERRRRRVPSGHRA